MSDDEDDDRYETLADDIDEINRQVDELCTPEYLQAKYDEILRRCGYARPAPVSHMPMRYCTIHPGAVKNARPRKRTFCEPCAKNGYRRYGDALAVLLHQTRKVGYPLRIYDCPVTEGLFHLTKK